MYKTEKNRKNATVQIIQGEKNCEQEFIRLSLGLTLERMLAEAKGMVIVAVCCGHIGGTKLTGAKGLAFEVCLSSLAGVVPIVQCHS